MFSLSEHITIVKYFYKKYNNDLLKWYGLYKSSVPARKFLYYVPLTILATGNLWNDVAVNHSLLDTVCRIACMLCVGFIEVYTLILTKTLPKNQR